MAVSVEKRAFGKGHIWDVSKIDLVIDEAVGVRFLKFKVLGLRQPELRRPLLLPRRCFKQLRTARPMQPKLLFCRHGIMMNRLVCGIVAGQCPIVRLGARKDDGNEFSG